MTGYRSQHSSAPTHRDQPRPVRKCPSSWGVRAGRNSVASILGTAHPASTEFPADEGAPGTRGCALICGITGQDGCYLTELLLDKGQEAHGIIRQTGTFNTDRIDHLYVDAHRDDATRARDILGWQPEIGLDEPIERMVNHDMELARQEKTLCDGGHDITPRGTAND